MEIFMKIYESVIIVNSSLNEDTQNRIIGRYEELIKKQGGSLRETVRWGKRRLAYPIKKFQYGYYIIFEFESASALVSELEREYRLNEEHILRFMTLHKDKKALLAEEQKKVQDAVQAKEAADQQTAKVPDAKVTDGVSGEKNSEKPSDQEPVKAAKDEAVAVEEPVSVQDDSAEEIAAKEPITEQPAEESNNPEQDSDETKKNDENTKE
jgi:small subunit ribosomal protein S6